MSQRFTGKQSNKRFKREKHTETVKLNTGLVIATHGATVEVEDEKKHIHPCISRKKVGVAVCGDQVQWHSEPNQTGLIHEIHPRKNLLARPDARNKLKPVAANIDYLIITLAPTPSAIQEDETSMAPQSDKITLFDFHAIDRYIVAAEASNIQAMIVINKVDLLSKEQLDDVESRLAHYHPLGYPYVFTSPKQNKGLSTLYEYIHHRTCVFVGQSGVGKSSLIQHYVNEADIQVGSISKVTGQGRHTTTATRLYHLGKGGQIIDSPGVREFGLWNIEAKEIMHAFKEFRPHIGKCKFNNCLHSGEPGCAVKAAVNSGEIHQERYSAYQKVLVSLNDPR